LSVGSTRAGVFGCGGGVRLIFGFGAATAGRAAGVCAAGAGAAAGFGVPSTACNLGVKALGLPEADFL